MCANCNYSKETYEERQRIIRVFQTRLIQHRSNCRCKRCSSIVQTIEHIKGIK